jgi:hypothetical protein
MHGSRGGVVGRSHTDSVRTELGHDSFERLLVLFEQQRKLLVLMLQRLVFDDGLSIRPLSFQLEGLYHDLT